MDKHTIGQIQQLNSGTQIAGRYQILELIGVGAMSSVYKAVDTSLEDEIVALKILHPTYSENETIFQRFRNEVLIARKLTHPNIVRIYDFGEHNSLSYISMEYVDGMTLEKRLASYSQKPLTLHEVYYILYQVSQGLSFAHEHQIIHRDLKPANILIGQYGEIKVADFGIARLLNETNKITAAGECVGTPHYMSPEQILGEDIDGRTDIYALGIMAYELLTGEVPFPDQTWYNLAARHLNTPLPPLDKRKSKYPRWLRHLIKKCTEKKPHARFQDMTQISKVIARHLPTHQTNKSILNIKRSRADNLRRIAKFFPYRLALKLCFVLGFLGLALLTYDGAFNKKGKKTASFLDTPAKPTWKCEVKGKTYFTDSPGRYSKGSCQKI